MRVIFFLVFLIIGAILCVTGLRGLYYANISVDWPVTEGKIIESKTSKTRASPTTYSPSVRYTYYINGELFESNRIYFAGIQWSSRSEYAEQFSRQFKPGYITKVYYDPDQPNLSVLIPGVRKETWFTFLLSGAFILFALVGIYIDRRHNQKNYG